MASDNIHTAELTTSELESNASSTGPTRILVQTKTHLVPGNDYLERLHFMLDLVCQHRWNRNYLPGVDRWNTYGARFGYPNRTCYFLVDNGESFFDGDVPVSWYEWTGESLNTLSQPLSQEIKSKLEQYPFTKPASKDILKPISLDVTAKRQSIRTKLQCDMAPSESDFKFMDHPDNLKWLKNHVESRFWSKFETLARSRSNAECHISD